jgi:hypothetical protein
MIALIRVDRMATTTPAGRKASAVDGQQRHADAAPTHRAVLASVLPARLLAP